MTNKNYIKSGMVHLMTMSVLLLCFSGRSQAQQFSNFDQQKTDSLAAKEYKQVLPIWGKQAVAKGFDLPEPLGFASNFMHFKPNKKVIQPMAIIRILFKQNIFEINIVCLQSNLDLP